ncbi:MAG: adenylate/guanylate cyclase domain-containing protein [Armatimonadota bacterium]|nr:adenylate/guanylate cyclase domain-containing protein [Armatimonadota bacterium]MDR7548345.1 adenylate/guanylate cyclase domain-containing protein [Armatimonadota bacterium]
MAAPTAERRVVSVLFADLVASTPLAVRLDPEPVREILTDYFTAMREEVERYGGVVEKFIGDAVMAVFGLPAAHEDDPQRAIHAALAMRQRMGQLNARLRADLRVRIGISTGEVVADPAAVGAGEFMVTGEAVNLAARLQQQAAPDAVVIDERTCEASWGVVQCQPLETPRDGDFAGRPRWIVLGITDRRAAKRLRAPLLGRESEMQFLHALYRRAVESRRPHLVTVIGPAGVGKSRLAEEFLGARRDEADGPQVLRGRCPAYGEGLTYWPLAEMLKQECGIKDNDPADVVTAKLRDGVRRVGVTGEDEREMVAAALAPLLGVEIAVRPDPGSGRLQGLRRSVEGRATVLEPAAALAGALGADDALPRALRTILAAKGSRRPLVLVVEDLHWAEQSLLGLLEHLAIRITDAPMLLLCLARPELLERHPHWGSRVRNYTAVSLAPLSEELSRRLIANLLHSETVPGDVREAILARAEGNPFFIEEILRMMIDGGGLVRDEQGWRWASRPHEMRLPDTIHGILVSRLDLLSALEKRVVQDASVMGRVFWMGPLIATSGLHAAEVTTALDRLQEREVIDERPTSSISGEREFVFRHALIREVAYASLPKSERSLKHIRFAQWLESAAGDDEELLPVLARHGEQAWRYKFENGEQDEALARKAINTFRRAGRRASQLRTLPEALRLFERALSVLHNAGLAGDVSLLLEVLTERSEVAKWMNVPEVVVADTETVMRLAPAIGRQDLIARAWLNRAFAEYARNHLEPAEDAIGRALALFGELHDRGGEAEALEVLGFIMEDLRGALTKAHAAYLKAFDLYRTMNGGQGMARTLARLGRVLLDHGELAGSREALSEAMQLSRAHNERLSEANAVTGLAVLAHLTGDDAEAERRFQEAIALRHELGDLLAEAYTHHRLAMHHLRVGRLDDAEREFNTARTLRREHGATGESALMLRGLAEISLARGDLLAAAELAEQALGLLAETDPISQATHLATLGRIRAAQGRRDEAEALFRRSLEVLERAEFRIDLALALLRYGEALQWLGEADRARGTFERARGLFAAMGATRFVRELDARLAH